MTESPAVLKEEEIPGGDAVGEARRDGVVPGSTNGGLARDLREIIDYVHAHLADPSLSVKTIRRACRIGNHNVSSRFQVAMDVSISDYIRILRMEAAGRLLGQADLPIYRVGSLVGFTHQESFTRTFRRHFGCSPSAYRRKLLDSQANGSAPPPLQTPSRLGDPGRLSQRDGFAYIQALPAREARSEVLEGHCLPDDGLNQTVLARDEGITDRTKGGRHEEGV